YVLHSTSLTPISSLSLHDALPILPAVVPGLPLALRSRRGWLGRHPGPPPPAELPGQRRACIPASHSRRRRQEESGRPVQHGLRGDRKSTRLNSSHQIISYAVFCLK